MMKRSSSSLISQRKLDYGSTGSIIDDMDDEKDETKSCVSIRKSRNLSEKKRRDQFNMLINELCSMVTTNNQKMDKSTVLRSTISFLRNHSDVSIHSECSEVQEDWKPSFLSNEEFTHLMLEALDGFVIVFSVSGRILYMSESITSLLGYLPNDLSSSIFEVVHESDKPSLFKLLNSAPASTDNGHLETNTDNCVSLLLHMKHGPIYSPESPTYEQVQLMGTFHHWSTASDNEARFTASSLCASLDYDSNSCSSVCSPVTPVASSEWRSCFVAMARFQNPQLLREMTVSDGTKNEFISRHSLEWKFLFLDHRAPPIIGYLPFEVLGTSGYDYYHIDDLDRVSNCHEALMQTGEGTSCYYRFLTKGQQWIWLQTRYFITYHQWNSKPEFIVCTHSVISYDEVQSSFFKENRKITNSEESEESAQKMDNFPAQLNTSMASNPNLRQSPTPSISSRCSISSKCSEISSVTSSVRPSVVSNRRTSLPSKHLSALRLVSSADNRISHPHQHDEPEELHPQEGTMTPTPIEDDANNPPTILMNLNDASLIEENAISTMNVVDYQEHQSTMEMNSGSMMELRNETNNNGGVVSRPHSTASSSADVGSNQNQIQDYLRRRHQLLQQQIIFQQEELRRVSEQLMLVQFVAPNLPASPIPGQEGTSNITAMTMANPNDAAMLPTPQHTLAAQHNQILTQHHFLLQHQTSMSSESEASLSIPKSTVLTSTTLINQPSGSHLLPSSPHLMPLTFPQEQAHVVFAQGFDSSPHHHCF